MFSPRLDRVRHVHMERQPDTLAYAQINLAPTKERQEAQSQRDEHGLERGSGIWEFSRSLLVLAHEVGGECRGSDRQARLAQEPALPRKLCRRSGCCCPPKSEPSSEYRLMMRRSNGYMSGGVTCAAWGGCASRSSRDGTPDVGCWKVRAESFPDRAARVFSLLSTAKKDASGGQRHKPTTCSAPAVAGPAVNSSAPAPAPRSCASECRSLRQTAWSARSSRPGWGSTRWSCLP